jgi:hypothetical protein
MFGDLKRITVELQYGVRGPGQAPRAASIHSAPAAIAGAAAANDEVMDDDEAVVAMPVGDEFPTFEF